MLPADDGARALLELRNADALFVHLVHPRATTWDTLMAPVAAEYNLQFVPFAEWVVLLEASGHGLSADAAVDALRANPALKLVQLFTQAQGTNHIAAAVGARGLDTSLARHGSRTLTDMLPLSSEHTRTWLAYWRRHGHL